MHYVSRTDRARGFGGPGSHQETFNLERGREEACMAEEATNIVP